MAEPGGRPLPALTLENEFFWTSGADGILRFQQCQSCSAFIHPPQPACRYCRSRELSPRPVSGFATLIGFTVSHRFSLPGLPAPYVVAQVAIEDDPRVRFTTNAVECEPGDLTLGMRMEAVFERAGDVWLPLFRPAAAQPDPPAPLPADEIAPDAYWRHVRPMITREKFEDKAVISGVGASAMGRRLMRPPLSLTVDACERAVADAGLTMADIDGLSTYPGGGNVAPSARAASPRSRRRSASTRSGTTVAARPSARAGSLIAAMLAVAGGLARHVLCFRTLWEATYSELLRQGKIAPPGGRVTGWMDAVRRDLGRAHPRDERRSATSRRTGPRGRRLAGSRSTSERTPRSAPPRSTVTR